MTARRSWLLGCVVAVVILIAAFLIVRWFEARDTERFVAEVSELAVPIDWDLISEVIYPVQYAGFSTNPSPGLARTWQPDEQITRDTLTSIAAPAGLVLVIDGDCLHRSPNGFGPETLCEGTGVKNGHSYRLNVTDRDNGSFPVLILSVRP